MCIYFYRNPTPAQDPDIGVIWEPMGNDDNYLNITVPPKMEKNMLGKRMSVWNNFFRDVIGTEWIKYF